MLRRPNFVKCTAKCLKMTKKCSIFVAAFLALFGSKWGLLAENRISGTFFALSFAENRKSISLLVLEIFAFKSGSHIYLSVSALLVLYFESPFLFQTQTCDDSKVNNSSSICQIPTKVYIFGKLRGFGVHMFQF